MITQFEPIQPSIQSENTQRVTMIASNTSSRTSETSKTGKTGEISKTGKPSSSHIDKVNAKNENKIKTTIRKKKTSNYIGWKQIGHWEEKDVLTDDDFLLDLTKDTLLDSVIPEALYGDWYHTMAIVAVAGLLSFAMGKFKWSLAPVFFVILLTSLYYRTSTRKYRTRIRDLVQKEFTVQDIEDDYESMEWLNLLLDTYWPIIEPTVSQMIVTQANDILATHPKIPAFITNLWIDQFTLGVKPPRIEAVKTFQNTESDVVVMDWSLSFTPHDLTDMTAKQNRNYVNQLVLLKLKLFKFLTIPIACSNVSFKINIRLRFKLMESFPHMETVNIQLIDIPDIDFIAQLLGNTIFNWEIMAIPGLYPFIKIMSKKYLGPMLMSPFSLQLNIPSLLSNTNLSVGIVELTIKNATDLHTGAGDLLQTSVDPYLRFEVNGKFVGKTRIVRDSLNPVWNETSYILVNSLTDPLTISVLDKRVRLKDKLFGRIEFNLNSINDSNNNKDSKNNNNNNSMQKDLKADFLRNSKKVGTLNFNLKYFPTLQPKRLPNGTVEELPDLNTGIAKIVVDEIQGMNSTLADEDNLNNLDDKAKDEIKKKQTDLLKESYSVQVFMNAKSVLKTSKVKNDINGIMAYSEQYEAMIADRRKTTYRFVVKNSKDEVVCSTVQTLNELIDRSEIDKKSIPLKDSNGGSIKISAYWRPVRLDFGSNSVAYTPPIGVVRVFIQQANSLLNLEKIGKIDPYAKVLVNGISRGRTDEVSSTLNPVWKKSIYVAVTSPNQRVTLEVMDVESADKDRSVGKFDINLQTLFEKNEDDKYEAVVDDKPHIGRLITKKGVHGNVTYYISFYPIIPVLTLEEIEDSKKIEKKKLELFQKKAEKKKLSKEEKEQFEEDTLAIEGVEHMFKKKEKLTLDQLMKFKSGVLAISVLDGNVSQRETYVQAFFDSNGHYRFVSPKLNSTVIKDGWTGDVTIKELDYSITTFRVTKHKNANKAEDCLCEVTVPTSEIVKNCYYKPSVLNLSGDASAKLLIQAQWFPLDTKELPQTDLITNQGDLVVTAKSAENLISADTNGYSDPYLKFYINDEEDAVFKTRTQKKTLNPTWNESKTCEITNRVMDVLHVKVMDWDATSGDDCIGWGKIKLSEVVPYEITSIDVKIRDGGQDGGIVHLDFEFNPRYIITTTKRETNVGDVAAKGLGTGIKAGTTVVGAGFDTVGKIGKGILGVAGIGKSKKKHKETIEEE